jgi:DNA repair exonuclease SbcCD nuclease subunit
MARILLTSDWHVKKGIYTDICINFLDFLHKYYKENDIDYLFIPGDIFDKSSSIKNEAFIPLYKKLYEMKTDGINFLFLLGNHDIINVDNDSIIETFSPIGKVIKQEEIIKLFNREFTFLPYTKKEEQIPKSGDILITHLPIADFSFDNAYHATEKNAFKKMLFEEFNFVFSGHFHRHQSYKNIVYIGSPYQMNRGEREQEKGFIVFDTETESWEFIKYEEAPVYIEITDNDFKNIKNIDFNNKFVSIRTSTKINEFPKLRYILYEMGALDIQPILETIMQETIITNEVEVNKSIEDIMKEYIINLKVEGIDNNKILKIFEKMLKMV